MNINSIIASLPQVILDEYQMYDLKTWIMEGIGFLPDTTLTEKITYLTLTNGKAELPLDFKKVMATFWQMNDPTPEECQQLNCTTAEEVQVETCKMDVYLKIFLDSPYFRTSFVPLKYVGDVSLLCRMCPNLNNCTEQFHIKNKTLYSSITDGYLCFHYLGMACDANGDILLEDSQVVKEYLIKFVLKRVAENKMLLKEENGMNLYSIYKQEVDILFRRARAELMFKETNADNIKTVASGYYFNFLTSFKNVST